VVFEMSEKDKREFWDGIMFGVLIFGAIILLLALTLMVTGYSLSKEPVQSQDFCGYDLPKEDSINEQVKLISSQWNDCYLSIDDSNQIGWKCAYFWHALPYVCQKELIVKEQVRLNYDSTTCSSCDLNLSVLQSPLSLLLPVPLESEKNE
jgi:hypothetical protein